MFRRLLVVVVAVVCLSAGFAPVAPAPPPKPQPQPPKAAAPGDDEGGEKPEGEGGDGVAGIDDDFDDESNLSLSAMEAALKPQVLATLDQIAALYKRLGKLQDAQVEAALGAALRACYAERLAAGEPMTWRTAVSGFTDPNPAHRVSPNPGLVTMYARLRRDYAMLERLHQDRTPVC